VTVPSHGAASQRHAGDAAAGGRDRPSVPLAVVAEGLEVELVTGEVVRYANLDNAASTSPLSAVADAVDEFLPWYSSVHRGDGLASQVSTEAYAAARAVVASFVSARETDTIVFTRNTTDSFNLLARALPPGARVITFAAEHHANLLPWRSGAVHHLPIPATPDAALEMLEQALGDGFQGPRLVSVTGASNATGELWPIEALAAVAHRHGARLALDAAQLVAHRPVDMRALDVDYLAFSGHKLYAPYGAGVLIGRGDWLDTADPYLAGGGAVRSVSLDDVEWVDGHARHEAGSPNVLGAVAVAAACRAIAKVGWPAIVDHERRLTAHLHRGLASLDGVQTYSMWDGEHDRIGVAAFNLAGCNQRKLGAILSAEFGIAVRHGAFCAHPLMDQLAAGPETRGGAVRASVGVATETEHIDRLLNALVEIRERGPCWTYAALDGRVAPDPDPRTLPRLQALDRCLSGAER
jgi:selenocysteine lyase/cysteine desulfurase